MKIRISRKSEVPVHEQLVNQIIVLIATGNLKAGDTLPSVRTLARLQKVHRNTVSRAYQELVDERFLIRQAGRLMQVAPLEELVPPTQDLDSLINLTIRVARESGYTMEELRKKVWERLRFQSPDHLLVVSTDPGMCRILKAELEEELRCPIKECLGEDLASDPKLGMGALVAFLPGMGPRIEAFLPREHPPYQLTICEPKEHIDVIRQLDRPSLIAVVSISKLFLERARGFLAPFVGEFHSFREYQLPRENPSSFAAADLVFCDSVAMKQVKARGKLHYRIISPASIEAISQLITYDESAR